MNLLSRSLLALAFVPLFAIKAHSESLKKCEIQYYPRSCEVRKNGNDLAIGMYLNKEYQNGYRWHRIAPNTFKELEGKTVWKASRSGSSTIYKSWQCPPRESCQTVILQIWD